MNRRALLGRFAAVAGALVLAPSVGTVEASEAPEVPSPDLARAMALYERGLVNREDFFRLHGIALPPVPTFEAMQADCAARGCAMEIHRNDLWRTTVLTHPGPGGPAYQIDDYPLVTDPTDTLAAVDAWRRSLHDA